MTIPLCPCPHCGAYLQQAGWSEDDLPRGAKLARRHAKPNCLGKRGKGYADYRREGMEALHVMVPAAVKRQVERVAAFHGVTTRDVIETAVADFAKVPPLERLAKLQPSAIKGDDDE